MNEKDKEKLLLLFEREEEYSRKLSPQTLEEVEFFRQKFPACPECKNNHSVQRIVYGMIEPIETNYHVYRGCRMTSPEGWTCKTHGDFMGHTSCDPAQ